jgi:hypothetical protein
MRVPIMLQHGLTWRCIGDARVNFPLRGCDRYNVASRWSPSSFLTELHSVPDAYTEFYFTFRVVHRRRDVFPFYLVVDAQEEEKLRSREWYGIRLDGGFSEPPGYRDEPTPVAWDPPAFYEAPAEIPPLDTPNPAFKPYRAI